MTDDNILEVDLDHLTVGEIEEIEEITGLSIDAAMDPGVPKGKFLRALGFVMKRRADPSFTLEQAGALRIELVEGSESDPKEQAAEETG